MRRKSGDRFPTRYVKNIIKVMQRDDCTTREILNRMIAYGWRQIPQSNQMGGILRSSGFFDKVGMTKTGKITIWRVREEKAIARGWLDPSESD